MVRGVCVRYATKAMKAHAHLKQWHHVAKCHLHSAVILMRLARLDEAVRCNAQVGQAHRRPTRNPAIMLPSTAAAASNPPTAPPGLHLPLPSPLRPHPSP